MLVYFHQEKNQKVEFYKKFQKRKISKKNKKNQRKKIQKNIEN